MAFIFAMNARDARAIGLGQGVGGVGAGREQHPVEKLVGGELVPRPQAGVAGVPLAHVPDHGGRDGDPPVQVARPDHDEGGHHLGDAGHRAFGVQVAAPQQPAGGRDSRPRPTWRRRLGGGCGARGGAALRGCGARGGCGAHGGCGARRSARRGAAVSAAHAARTTPASSPVTRTDGRHARQHGHPAKLWPDNRGKPVSCGTTSQSPRANRWPREDRAAGPSVTAEPTGRWGPPAMRTTIGWASASVPGLDVQDGVVAVVAVGGDPGGEAILVRSKVYLFRPDQDRYPARGPQGGRGGVQRQGAEHRLHDAAGQDPLEQVRVADEAGQRGVGRPR